MLKRVEFSRLAAPIVSVPKSDGTFRLCGDYKVTVNSALVEDQHPLPKLEEIFASLAVGQCFTTLDLSQAYQQLAWLAFGIKRLHMYLYGCKFKPLFVSC